jgi:hypothetical protein
MITEPLQIQRPVLLPLILLGLLLILSPPSMSLAEPHPETILARAKARAAAEIFTPFRYTAVARTLVRNGQDELEHEELSHEEAIQWTPDSTQVISEEVEIIFTKGEPDEEEASEKDDDELGLEFDFLAPHKVDGYEFKFIDFVQHGGSRLARFEMKPRKEKKDHWQGSLFLDPKTGTLRSVDIEPAKKQFGLKRMRVRSDFIETLGMDMPVEIDIDIEAKVIFIFHAKIRTTIELTVIGPAG